MTIDIYALIFSLAMIMLTKIPVAWAMNQQPGGYDNRYPREQQSDLDGFGKRALAAHQNAIEAFPMFSAGLLVALITQADTNYVELLCIAFILSRLAYTLCYWLNLHILRSSSWTIGFSACLGLMILPLV